MKRNASQPSGSASSTPAKNSKRQKTTQACSSCRKAKSRCEVLDDRERGSIIRCHRCKVLNQHCSYQDMDKSELSESLRLPKSKVDKNKVSRNESTPTFPHWEEEVLRVIESAGASTLLKTTQGNSKQSLLMWDLFRLPDGSRLDWSAPLEAIQQLTKWSETEEDSSRTVPTASPPDDSLEQILTSEQTDYLLDIFSERYTPWLNFTLVRENHHDINSMLDLVCCTIASRHLDDSTRSTVTPRLQALTQNYCARLIFQSRNSSSLEAIQSLLILSLWAPVCGASEESRDARMLIGSAVSIAMNYRLNEACDKAFKMLVARQRGEMIDETAFEELMNKSRLWLSIANAESMLCVGSGRVALSKRDYEAYRMIFTIHSSLSSLPSDLTAGRDIRLKMFAELYDYAETGMALRFTSMAEADVEKWYDTFVHVFQNFDRITRLVLPLGVLSDNEKLHYKMLVISVKFCRLLLLYHGLSSARLYHRDHNSAGTPDTWFRDVRPRGVALVITWSKEAFQISEAILVSLLELDSSMLSTAPDHLFTMISFTVGYCLGSIFIILKGVGIPVPGSTRKIIERLIGHLMQASVSRDSAARKCAGLVSVMIALYKARREEILAAPRPPGIEQLGSYPGMNLVMMMSNLERSERERSTSASRPQSQSNTFPSSDLRIPPSSDSDPSPAATESTSSPASTLASTSSASSPLSSGLPASANGAGGTLPSTTHPHLLPNDRSSLHPHTRHENPYHHHTQNQGVGVGVGLYPSTNVDSSSSPSANVVENMGLGQSGLLPSNSSNTGAVDSGADVDMDMLGFGLGWFNSQEFWNDYIGSDGYDLNVYGFPSGHGSGSLGGGGTGGYYGMGHGMNSQPHMR